MNDTIKFKAPWGASLIFMTALCIVILLGVSLIGIFFGPRQNISFFPWIIAMVIFPLITLIISVFFIIRGYIITDDFLFIQRLGWKSKVDLTDLVSAEYNPDAMDSSIRTFGNGGLFAFAGAFYNKNIGSYRAFATIPERSVVLKFQKHTVVVTPDKPKEFVEKIKNVLTNRAMKGIK